MPEIKVAAGVSLRLGTKTNIVTLSGKPDVCTSSERDVSAEELSAAGVYVRKAACGQRCSGPSRSSPGCSAFSMRAVVP